MKYFVILIVFFYGFICLQAQDEGLSDIYAQRPNGKEMKVKILREDCNFGYYAAQRGGTENKTEWSKIQTWKYDEESQSFSIAKGTFEGTNPNYVSALSSFEKVLLDKQAKKWELDWSVYHIGLCHLGLGQLDKAKEKFTSIKNDSRWFYPAKLKVIDTLPEEAKIPAIKDLLKGTEVTGPFKLELSFMLVDRYIADGKGNEAKQAFEDLKKIITAPDKSTSIQLDEYQIKIDVMNKNFADAEKKINQYVSAGTETGLMRIALGDVYLSKSLKVEAYYEYLRGRLDFDNVDAEAGFKVGKLFYDLWLEDKIVNAVFINYAKKELYNSYKAGDGVWSTKAKKMIDQLKF